MPVLDMPLDQLKEYKGSSPRPLDFDSYWDTSLQEMRSVKSDCSLIDADFKAPGIICQDLFFTGVGGIRIHANFAHPVNDGKKHPAILFFHGYTASAPDFMDLLPYAYAGFYIAALDVRGQGGKSETTGSKYGPSVYGHLVNGLNDPDPKGLFFRNVFLDTAQLASIIMAMPEVDETKVGAMGGSQGGALTLACAALEPRIACAFPQFPWLCDFKRVWDMDMDCRAYQGIRDYMRHFDPQHKHEDEIFTKLGYIDVQNLTSRIKAKTTMVTGLMDDVCPPSTQFAAFNKIQSEKDLIIYYDYGHEMMPGYDELAFTFMKKHLLDE